MIPISIELINTIAVVLLMSFFVWISTFLFSLFITYSPADPKSKAAEYSAILATIVTVIVFLFQIKVFVLVP